MLDQDKRKNSNDEKRPLLDKRESDGIELPDVRERAKPVESQESRKRGEAAKRIDVRRNAIVNPEKERPRYTIGSDHKKQLNANANLKIPTEWAQLTGGINPNMMSHQMKRQKRVGPDKRSIGMDVSNSNLALTSMQDFVEVSWSGIKVGVPTGNFRAYIMGVQGSIETTESHWQEAANEAKKAWRDAGWSEARIAVADFFAHSIPNFVASRWLRTKAFFSLQAKTLPTGRGIYEKLLVLPSLVFVQWPLITFEGAFKALGSFFTQPLRFFWNEVYDLITGKEKGHEPKYKANTWDRISSGEAALRVLQAVGFYGLGLRALLAIPMWLHKKDSWNLAAKIIVGILAAPVMLLMWAAYFPVVFGSWIAGQVLNLAGNIMSYTRHFVDATIQLVLSFIALPALLWGGYPEYLNPGFAFGKFVKNAILLAVSGAAIAVGVVLALIPGAQAFIPAVFQGLAVFATWIQAVTLTSIFTVIAQIFNGIFNKATSLIPDRAPSEVEMVKPAAGKELAGKAKVEGNKVTAASPTAAARASLATIQADIASPTAAGRSIASPSHAASSVASPRSSVAENNGLDLASPRSTVVSPSAATATIAAAASPKVAEAAAPNSNAAPSNADIKHTPKVAADTAAELAKFERAAAEAQQHALAQSARMRMVERAPAASLERLQNIVNFANSNPFQALISQEHERNDNANLMNFKMRTLLHYKEIIATKPLIGLLTPAQEKLLNKDDMPVKIGQMANDYRDAKAQNDKAKVNLAHMKEQLCLGLTDNQINACYPGEPAKVRDIKAFREEMGDKIAKEEREIAKQDKRLELFANAIKQCEMWMYSVSMVNPTAYRWTGTKSRYREIRDEVAAINGIITLQKRAWEPKFANVNPGDNIYQLSLDLNAAVEFLKEKAALLENYLLSLPDKISSDNAAQYGVPEDRANQIRDLRRDIAKAGQAINDLLISWEQQYNAAQDKATIKRVPVSAADRRETAYRQSVVAQQQYADLRERRRTAVAPTIAYDEAAEQAAVDEMFDEFAPRRASQFGYDGIPEVRSPLSLVLAR